MDALKKLRDRIDWLDTQIASFLNERMRAADQVGKIKRMDQKEVTDQSREKNVLNNVEMIIQHPTLKANIANIYGQIMQESRIAQQFFRHLSQPFRRIGIIGLGLMGGSICKGIKMKDPSIAIGTLIHASDDLSLADEEGWIDQVYASIGDLIQNSELIILATPISTILGLAEELKSNLASSQKLIVIDLASVKKEIIDTFEKLTVEKIEFIGTHPMAGKELGGFANSQATLFVNRPWVVVPHQANSSSGVESIKELIRYLGSEPICLDAATHDQQAALISHIPMILAKSYFDFVGSTDPESMKIAGPGFQSFTRLAHDNDAMRMEITECNQKMINHFLDIWLESLIKNRGH